MNDRFLTDDEIAAEGITPDQLENPWTAIDLTVERVACPRHGEPFRHRWPQGFPTLATTLLQAVLEDPAFVGVTGGEVDQINTTLTARAMCERVSKPTLMAAYITSGVGVEKRCELCRERSLGTPYKMGRPGGVVSYRHVCFSCVIYRLNPAQ